MLSLEVNILLFTDNIVIYSTSADITHCTFLLQTALESLFTYLGDRGLEISPQKSQLILFSKILSLGAVFPSLTLDGSQLRLSEAVRFLGVLFDTKLAKYQSHTISYM